MKKFMMYIINMGLFQNFIKFLIGQEKKERKGSMNKSFIATTAKAYDMTCEEVEEAYRKTNGGVKFYEVLEEMLKKRSK
jgi:cysteine sulfinate desulfinase/cysteine desulfurase-like protein